MSAIPKLNKPPPTAAPKAWKRWLERIAMAVASGLITAAVARKMRRQVPQHVLLGPPMDEYDLLGFQDVDLSGRGKYTMRKLAKNAISGLGMAGGATLGAMTAPVTGPYGAAIGTMVGSGLGDEVGNAIFGRGAYTVTGNSLVKSASVLPEGSEVPTFIGGNEFTRIRHREFIQDIVVPVGPTNFVNNEFVINPGNTLLFPWLATIASNFQQYELMGLVFYFKSTTSDFATNGALGTVILATNYDVLESKYVSKIIMENSQFAVSAKPSRSQLHAIECDPKKSSQAIKYVRDSTSSTSQFQDNRFYDHGKFQIATSGLASTAGQVLGELWCTYDIKLFKPELGNTLGQSNGQVIQSNGSVSKTNFFGSSPVVSGYPITTAVTNTLTFITTGKFLLTIYVVGTGLVDPIEATTTVNPVQAASVVNAAGTQLNNTYIVTVTSTGQNMVFDWSTSTSVNGADVRVTTYAFT